MSDDFTEVLLLLTNLIKDLPQVISIEDYRKARRIRDWNVEVEMMDEEFENKLDEIVETGKQLLSKIRLNH